MDLGTGDGRFVLAQAAAIPDRLVLGVDAVADPMIDASRRAGRSPARRGLPNARFVVASLEALPPELDGLVDQLTVHFPWGTLRDAAIGRDAMATARLARLLAPAGRLELLVADGERDAAAHLDPAAVVVAYAAVGLEVEARPATLADAIGAHSSWGKRLLRNTAPGRSAWYFQCRARSTSSRLPTRIEP
ncbi:MAG TPA: class I SAM-dependent methyltransferase [Candidatus Limnocylindria bacterium]|nr:class I SAM-dependent methyltransferase [Candidatus Limnocylindria bacterium]